MAEGSSVGIGTAEWGVERREMLASIADRLGSDREAQWIIEHIEHVEQVERMERVEADEALLPTPTERREQVEALVGRRLAGEPLQYVLGRWAFRSLELWVDRRVLIPRPETERVVEVALAELDRMHEIVLATGVGGMATPPTTFSPICVDLGTGSGAIALALATESMGHLKAIEVWATDVSADALEVAIGNLEELSSQIVGLESHVQFVQGSWFDALPNQLMGRVDLLVSNPPYVAESEFDDLDSSVRDWEPPGALVAPMGTGGVGGMADIETIVATAPRWLRSSGTLVVEIAPGQAYAAIDAARRAGFNQVTTERDLAGRLRMLVARR